MRVATFTILLLCVPICFGQQQHNYDKYKLLKISTTTEAQSAAIGRLEEALARPGLIDIWRRSRGVIGDSDVMVHPDYVDYVSQYFTSTGAHVHVAVDNIQTLIDKERESLSSSRSFLSGQNANSIDTKKYHSYDDITAYLQSVSQDYANITELKSIGKSHENRDLWVLKIGAPATNKNGFWIDAGLHAREWIAPATAIYIINDLVSAYGQDATITKLLNSIDFYILPSFNPDGYEYSRNSERLWRKTRSGPRKGTFGEQCYGVDPNRNWDFHWGGEGTSTNACSDIYEGPQAFSEVECKAGSAYLTQLKDVLKAMITLHSYSEDILYPYGYQTHTYPPDVDQLHALGDSANNAVKSVRGTSYSVINSADSLYPAAGASDDWSKHLGIKWVYTIELRPGPGDTDNDEHYGFVLPAKYIERTADEIWAGILVMANRVMTGPN